MRKLTEQKKYHININIFISGWPSDIIVHASPYKYTPFCSRYVFAVVEMNTTIFAVSTTAARQQQSSYKTYILQQQQQRTNDRERVNTHTHKKRTNRKRKIIVHSQLTSLPEIVSHFAASFAIFMFLPVVFDCCCCCPSSLSVVTAITIALQRGRGPPRFLAIPSCRLLLLLFDVRWPKIWKCLGNMRTRRCMHICVAAVLLLVTHKIAHAIKMMGETMRVACLQ